MQPLFLLLVVTQLYTGILSSSLPIEKINTGIGQIVENAQEIANKWIKFKLDNLKNFSPSEEIFRFDVFKQNLKRIQELTRKFQAGLISYTAGITKFADLTKEEFINKYLKVKTPPRRVKRQSDSKNRTVRQISSYIDWRQNGVVTPVKDQGYCASCWAFSTVGSIEGQYALRTGSLISFSVQNLVDCFMDQSTNGCNGGWMANAFEFLRSHSITSDDVYPYLAYQQQCQQAVGTTQIYIQGYQTIAPNEESLQQAVASIGPISAAMDATNLQFYAGGIFRDDECISGYVNHGVLVVGYGTEGDRDYWLVKNSWGANWGENGYFKIIRNRDNQCNVATYGMYPIM